MQDERTGTVPSESDSTDVDRPESGVGTNPPNGYNGHAERYIPPPPAYPLAAPYDQAEQGPAAPRLPYPGSPGTARAPVAYRSQAEAAAYTRRFLVGAGVVFLAFILMTAAFAVGGEPSHFMSIGIAFIPLAVLGALAFAGLRNNVSAVFCYAWLAIVAFGVLLNSFANALPVVVRLDVLAQLVQGTRTWSNTTAGELFKPNAGPPLLWTTLLLLLALLVATAMLLRPVRLRVARALPIDPDNLVHKVGLSILTLVLISSFAPLIALGGQPPLLELVKSPDMQSVGQQVGLEVRPIDLVYQFVWMIPTTFVVAGWPVARTFKVMLVRLGLVRPTLRQIGLGVGAGALLAVVGSYLIDPGITWLWRTLGWPTTDIGAFNQLMGNVISPMGAILVGITAGIGEELAVRGLLQPRIGLLASNLVFTSLHAFQYGVDALLSVFIVGLILGIIRARTNTTTSAIAHGTYDFLLVLASAVLGQ